MHEPSRSLAIGLIAALAILIAPAAHSAPFDERIKSPKAATPEEARTRLKAHFAAVERKEKEGPWAFVRDQAAYKEWSNLHYSITLAMDEALPLNNLDDVGLVARPDGTYSVDVRKFQAWRSLDDRLHLLTNPEVLRSFQPDLRKRGFTDGDLRALRAYVATHDWRQTAHEEGNSLLHTFARRLQEQRAKGMPLNLEEVLAYHYQRLAVRAEAQRLWAIGLLDSLDDRGQSILASFSRDLASEMMFGKPSEPFSRNLEQQAELLLSGAYLDLIAHSEEQLKKDMEGRAAKLIGEPER